MMMIRKSALLQRTGYRWLPSSLQHMLFSSKCGRMTDFVLVRHGESEGNYAWQRSKAGDHSLYSGEFLTRHSSLWRLTDVGIRQARAAGDWLKNNCSDIKFDRYYCSEYLRAMETAAVMDLPDAKWFTEVQLRERDWGQYDLASQELRDSLFADEEKRRARDSLFFAPAGGESLAHVCTRVDSVLNFLNLHCANMRVIMVCHGELMWGFRLRFERLTGLQYRELQQLARVEDRIHNGQILWYTRRNPSTGVVDPHFRWYASVCPWDMSRSNGQFKEIARHGHTNESLLVETNRYIRLYNRTEAEASGLPIAEEYEDSESEGHIGGGFTDEEKAVAAANAARLKPAGSEGMKMDNVLVVSKISRYEYERAALRLSGEELHEELTLRGFSYKRLRDAYVRHESGMAAFTNTLRRAGINFLVKPVGNASPEDAENADVVFSCGGDGTFLRSSYMTPHHKTLIGLNMDALRSSGILCAAEIGSTRAAYDFINKLRVGDYQVRKVPRIQITLHIPHRKKPHISSRMAVNEVLIAEKDPSRPFVCEISTDKHPEGILHRSSGVLVTTAIGATAWLHSATRVSWSQTQRIARALNRDLTEDELSRLTKTVNDPSFMFKEPRDPRSLYCHIREPIVDSEVLCKSQDSIAKRVSIRCLGFDAHVFLDSCTSVQGTRIPLDRGVRIDLEIGPETTDLITVSMPQSEKQSVPSPQADPVVV
eukprot:Rmarinus@m.26409